MGKIVPMGERAVESRAEGGRGGEKERERGDSRREESGEKGVRVRVKTECGAWTQSGGWTSGRNRQEEEEEHRVA